MTKTRKRSSKSSLQHKPPSSAHPPKLEPTNQHKSPGLFAPALIIGLVAIFGRFHLDGSKNDRRTNALIQWIEHHGGFIDSRITIRDGPFGRGAFIDDPIPDKDSKLYMVSDHCFLSLRTIQREDISVFAPVSKDPAFSELLENDTIQLALALLAERNTPESYWRPYLNTIPDLYPDQPLFWEYLDELQSPWVAQQIQISRNFLQSQMPHLEALSNRYPLLFPDNDKLWVDFAWAYYTVTSRAYDVGRPGEDRILGLVPFVDLLNHGFGDTATMKHSYTVEMPRDVVLFTGTPRVSLSSNVELLFKYNDMLETSRFLYMYGMLDSDYEKRVQGDFVILSTSSGVWPVNWQGRVDPSIFANETLPKQQLVQDVKTAIAELPTTLDDDKAALNACEDYRRVALVLRIRFKQILHRLLGWLDDGTVDGDDDTAILTQGDVKASRALFRIDV